MKNIFKLHKIIMVIFLICALVKIKSLLSTISSYEKEISVINDKIAILHEREENYSDVDNSKENNEKVARRDLKMYYPNETPYKGY